MTVYWIVYEGGNRRLEEWWGLKKMKERKKETNPFRVRRVGGREGGGPLRQPFGPGRVSVPDNTSRTDLGLISSSSSRI